MSDLRRLIESMDRIDEANLQNKPLDNQLLGGGGGGMGASGGYTSPGYSAGRSSGIGAGISGAKPKIERLPGETPAQAVARVQSALTKPINTTPTPLPAGVKPSTAGAGRGQAQLEPGSPAGSWPPQPGGPNVWKDAGAKQRQDAKLDRMDKAMKEPMPKRDSRFDPPSEAPGKSGPISGNKLKKAAGVAGALYPSTLAKDDEPIGGGGGGGSSGANTPSNTKPSASDVTLYPSVPQTATPNQDSEPPSTIDLPKVGPQGPNSPFTVLKPDIVTGNTKPNTTTVKPVEPPKQPASAPAQKPVQNPNYTPPPEYKPNASQSPSGYKWDPITPRKEPTPQPPAPEVKPTPTPTPVVKPTTVPEPTPVKPAPTPVPQPVVKPDIKPPAGGSGGGSGPGTGTGTTPGTGGGTGGGQGSGVGTGTGSGTGTGRGQSIYDFLKSQGDVDESAAMRAFKQFEDFIKKTK